MEEKNTEILKFITDINFQFFVKCEKSSRLIITSSNDTYRTCIPYRASSKSISGQLKRSDDDRLSVSFEILYPVVFLAEKARFLFPFRAITRAKLDDGRGEAPVPSIWRRKRRV